MARILVAEDSPTQALALRRMLEAAGHGVAIAKNGREAIAALKHGATDLVLTDLQMPEMDGLELVQAVRLSYPLIPVILMSAHGSEEIAAEALQRGAASYVPKRRMARDMIQTVGNILELTSQEKVERRQPGCWDRTESHYILENDVTLIPGLVAHLAENAARKRLCDGTGMIRVNVALSEALSNAILHGNLELDSSLREDDEATYYGLARSRRPVSPYCERRVNVTERETAEGVAYVIRDDGPGYDPGALPDPNDPANLERASGRGLLLIRTFMDEVSHNPRGNEITMFKRRESL
ncbi:response regulator [Singulisphaera sp. Ch08]|uniref:Response regulator n=1 Tax=Singulisphaera sp. Ch08 TaxID=3120278 RepID=A0AAU7C713_9BACT